MEINLIVVNYLGGGTVSTDEGNNGVGRNAATWRQTLLKVICMQVYKYVRTDMYRKFFLTHVHIYARYSALREYNSCL